MNVAHQPGGSPGRATAVPELAVVVLSVAAPPELRTAVESLKKQSVPLEIVVVNSDGGDPRAVLGEAGPGVKIVSVPNRLWPGAARNAGIRMSRAPWIAFMASDCIAKDGWAAGRLTLHRQGNRAVACAVVNSHPRNLFALAGHLAILVRRLPGVPRRERLLYGVSYARSLFEQYGEFREDLRIGEDTDFNNRLANPDKPVWAPQVQTIHLNPTTFRHMVKSQFARGWRSGRHWPAWKTESLPMAMYWRFKSIAWLSWASSHGFDRVLAVACWPLLIACVWAYGLGVSAGRRENGAAGEGGSECPGMVSALVYRWRLPLSRGPRRRLPNRGKNTQ